MLVKDIASWNGIKGRGRRRQTERAFAYEKKDFYYIPERKADSNKNFGKVLIAAGSAGMCGAALIYALTAYRAGAGLVKILTVEETVPSFRTPSEAIIASLYSDQLLQGREELKKMDRRNR